MAQTKTHLLIAPRLLDINLCLLLFYKFSKQHPLEDKLLIHTLYSTLFMKIIYTYI